MKQAWPHNANASYWLSPLPHHGEGEERGATEFSIQELPCLPEHLPLSPLTPLNPPNKLFHGSLTLKKTFTSKVMAQLLETNKQEATLPSKPPHSVCNLRSNMKSLNL